MDDDNIGKEGPEHFTEHGDEEGEDSDSGGSNVEEEHVRPYEHDPSFKSKEELEHFLKGCDNRIESESDSEDENVDYESWRGIRKLCHCGHCENIVSNGFEHLCCQQMDKSSFYTNSQEHNGHQSSGARAPELWCPHLFFEGFLIIARSFMLTMF